MSPPNPPSLPARRPLREPAVGDLFAHRLDDGRYAAVQVLKTARMRDGVELAALAWRGVERPGVDELRATRVVRGHALSGGLRPETMVVPGRVPWWVEHVGHLPPLEAFDESAVTFGGWESVFQAARRADATGTVPRLPPSDLTTAGVDLGSGPVALRRDTWRVSINEECLLPAAAAVRFGGLDALPRLAQLAYAGSDVGLVEYVRRRALSDLSWRAHGQSSVDLGGSRLRALTISTTPGGLTLVVPDTLRSLTIEGPTDRLRVSCPSGSFAGDLTVRHGRIGPPPAGCERIPRLTCNGIVSSDTEGLRGFVELKSLVLRGAPGRLSDGSGLTDIARGLRTLAVYDLYGLDPARWPVDWPLLDEAEFGGLAKADVALLKRSLATVPYVHFRGERPAKWIAENLDSPLRAWSDDPELGRISAGAWTKAKASARGATGRVAAEGVLRSFVTTLNDLSRKFDFDTIRREEAGEAVLQLASDLGVEPGMARAWFDAWREF